MLTAHRFTTLPTKDCQDRLEQALTNRRPIARGEVHRGAVVAIQSALADLNRGYLPSSEIDGFFGTRTYAAVEAFQRDYGLVADGMVAKQTMTQLDSLYGSDAVRQPRGLSVHVGVDRLDVAHYGDAFALNSCVNDSRKMQEIAQIIGYDTVTFENQEATVRNFTGFMRSAIRELYDGDSLLVTFSGHGSQVPDNSAEPEADQMNETLCFFDRMLVDDEFYALLGQFRTGVRVHAVFDSCHSGTVAKMLLTGDQKEYQEKTMQSLSLMATPPEEEHRPISSKSASKAADGDRPAPAEPQKPKDGQATDKEIAALFAELHNDDVPDNSNKKQMDDWQRVYDQNKDLYDAISNVVGPAESQELACSLVTLSACQDVQTTPAGRLYSLFTYNIVKTWNSAYFGSYKQFHGNLVSIAPPDSVPALNIYGTNLASARLYDRPFVF
jgi:metacaspase-1